MALPANWRVEQSPLCEHVLYSGTLPQGPAFQWVRPFPPPGYSGPWPLYYHAAHILIKHSAVRNPRSKNKKKGEGRITISREEALKRMVEIRALIETGKKPFEEMAYRFSDCNSSEKAGDLKWCKLGAMHLKFEQAALATPMGALSEPVESPSGWHIIKRLDGIIGKDARLLKEPPPPHMEFSVKEDDIKKYLMKDPKVFRVLQEKLMLTETHPHELRNWTDLLETYLAMTGDDFTAFTERVVFGLLFFHPGDETAIKNVLQRMDSLRAEGDAVKKFQNVVMEKVLLYTWNPFFWNKWVQQTDADDDMSQRIEKRRRMLASVGFTANSTSLWDQFVRLLRENGQPNEEVVAALKRPLSIGLMSPGVLLEQLGELDPDSRAEFEELQTRLAPRVQRRAALLNDKRSMSRSNQDDTFRKYRVFLDEELANPCQYPDDLYVDCIDYMYRFALSVLWWIPSIWMEYWSFLVKNGQADRADMMLSLGRSAVGDTPLFELKRAEHLVRYGRFSEAERILEKLVTMPDPLSTSALTLLFRAIADLDCEENAMKIITDNLEYARPQFFVNTAKLCQNPQIAWTIFQMGVDRFPGDDNLVIAAAEFLEQHRDVRNTRLLFQQSLRENRERFEIRRHLFQFELDHIAPLDHLNETQKVFKSTSVDPLVLYMQRYRFMDLYPIDTDELRVLGHLTPNGTFDLTDRPRQADDLTAIPPYQVDPSTLKRNQSWIDIVNQNIRRATNQEQQGGQKRMPPAVHRILLEIKDCQLHFMPPNVDQVIESITGFRIRDYRQQPSYDQRYPH